MDTVIEVEIRPQERIAVMPDLAYVQFGTDPILPTSFEASIDNGLSWKPGVDRNGSPAWFVAAPGYPGPNDDSDPALTHFTIVKGRTTMLVRIIDGPVTEIDNSIQLVLLS